MIPKKCKRLAEVDFPIAVVSKHSAREKSIRHGHPSTLHLWWARRPLGACRAMLLGLLLPDPCDPNCPGDFKEEARHILLNMHGRPIGWKKLLPTDEGLRKVFLKFIGDFADWKRSADKDYLEVGRGLVKAAHGEEPPLVVDPFAGGGSIPLEALRLGCEAFASDLNPVACLILKVMLEDIPRHGPELADKLRRVGKEIKKQAEKELAEFYPKDPDGGSPIAYLWARTVRCESPNCGAEIPLMRSFWLSKKAKRKRALKYKVIRAKGDLPAGASAQAGPPKVEFEIFEPKSDKEVPGGTVTRAKATCLCCNMVLPPVRVRAQLSEQCGGADVIFDKNGKRTGGARMTAVVELKSGEKGRHYRLPSIRDYECVYKAQGKLNKILEEWERGGRKGLCPVPDEPLPRERQKGNSGFRVLLYGMLQWGDLFTSRQKVALVTLVRLTSEQREKESYTSIKTALGVVINRCADYNSANCRWVSHGEFIGNTYTRQALPIVWDFAEISPSSDATGGYRGAIEWVAKVIDAWPTSRVGQIQQSDSADSPLPQKLVGIWFTDPPYYDAIAYADLSDFFFVWLKRTLPEHPFLRDPFDTSNPLTPKIQEAIQDRARHIEGKLKDGKFYESAMANAFAEGSRVLREDGIGSVVFAHKTTEGWEALLSGMIQGGWTITGSWPIATEMGSRLNARETASLATSVHLVCRPRPENAPVGDWGDVLRELPGRVADWMERLQSEGLHGADLVFACIGPALEIYSRYSKVVDPDERKIPLGGDPTEIDPTKRGYLSYVWEEIGRAALRQVLGIDAPTEIEEDARLTALFLWTARALNDNSSKKNEEKDSLRDEVKQGIQRMPEGIYKLPYDLVRRFCQPLGIHLDRWEGRLIETKKGIVRLLSVTERGKNFLRKEVRQEVDLLNIPESKRQGVQLSLFDSSNNNKSGKKEQNRTKLAQKRLEAETWSHLHRDTITVLDHVHKAMVLQKQGMTTALRELLFYEKTYQPDFLRLANALSALYPSRSEEKRLLDAMLLAVPR